MKKIIQTFKDTLSIFSSSKGFTLLELLVVVLIIGILAGIALPQYEKSVEKARLAEALLNISALQRGIDAYTLANGYPSSTINFLNDDPDAILDIDITGNCDENACFGNNFCYTAACSSGYCVITAERLAPRSTLCAENGMYDVTIRKRKEDDIWDEKICTHSSDYEYACKYLESQGFEREEAC